MRLAAGRRHDWLRYQNFGVESSLHLVPRRGMVEVVRLGEGEPIVLVPGLAGGWRLLMPLARRLAARHEVILYGLRGDRGPLLSPGAETIADHARDLAGLITELGLERPTVFGVSFGGAVALELAIAHPRCVGTMVLSGAEARFRMSLGPTIALRVLERFPLPCDNQFVNQFFNLLHGGKPQPGPLVDFVIERCWETDQGVMSARLRALESFDISDRVGQIDVPTLVLAGTRDVIVPPARQRALAAAIPDGQFHTLEGAGHIGFLTHRAEIEHYLHQIVENPLEALC